MITINESLIVLDDESSLGSVAEAIQAHPDKLHEIGNALGAAFSAAQTRGTAVAQSLAVKLNAAVTAAAAQESSHAAALDAEVQSNAESSAALNAELVASKAECAAHEAATVAALNDDWAKSLEKMKEQWDTEAKSDADFILSLKAELAASQAEFSAYKQAASYGADMIHSVIADPTKDAEATVAAITAIVTYAAQAANKTAREREIDAMDAELAAMSKQAAEMQAKRDALAEESKIK